MKREYYGVLWHVESPCRFVCGNGDPHQIVVDRYPTVEGELRWWVGAPHLDRYVPFDGKEDALKWASEYLSGDTAQVSG